ncbi:MAG: hypothetical protein KY476_05210 [Planctomycetes bacterium]|nr:hypothetical protein [Planctomycetota bacterium]
MHYRFTARPAVRLLAAALALLVSPIAIEAQDQPVEPHPKAHPLYIADADGGNPRLLIRDAEFEFDGMGSPEWSADGKRIAFDAWRASAGEGSSVAHIFVADVDGTNVRDLGPGAMPTFSPGGHRLVCSRYGGEERGVWVLNLNGDEPVLLEPTGWSGRWSPDGRKIAWTVHRRVEGRGTANIEIFEIIEGIRYTVFEGDEQSRYATVYWNFCWSPDSTAICFKGRLAAGQQEVAIVDAAGSSRGFRVRLPQVEAAEDLSWHPDGKRVLVSMTNPATKTRQLLTFDPAGEGEPVPLPKLDPDRLYLNGAWSPDGKQIVYSSRPKPSAN